MAVITYKGVLEVLSCGVCHVDFAIDQDWHAKLQRNGKDFWCPNGHQISYGRHVQSELERTQERLARAETRERAARDQADAAERQARAYKGHATRLRKRAAAGVCPCCTRTFQNLQRHMASQHPSFAGEQS